MAGDVSTPNIMAETVDKDGEKIVVNIDGDSGYEGQYKTSTKEVKEKTFPPFDANTFGPQLFWLAITFGILYLLMSKVALPRIGEILEVRRDRIEGDLAEAERLRQKTEQAIKAYEDELASARAKAHEIAEGTRANIKKEIELEREKVEAELDKKIASAEARIAQTKQEALANVDQIASETVVAIISKLSGKISNKEALNAVKHVARDS